ncbi:hypothetical protein J7E93_25665 [Streptomyces sp. ISL-36]|uniref:hypothetical protein n=1 Tax=Streptomyces sp. ISL-36 TaxID=2819182 RepID=UPI001BE52BC4|nr:hypothetical protein [Streptomyces sp. ISL-36]MBT2443420.1 hypothetical protein [Streptomyces sp. ISL-36]
MHEVGEGDVFYVPMSGSKNYLLGRVTGPYAYRNDFPLEHRHAIAVTWARPFDALDIEEPLRSQVRETQWTIREAPAQDSALTFADRRMNL